ncbi:transposable element Tcb1 transposase [Trichonephila clavipes]|nr:transposable element Tcb1 transposase [Trichonephila clavipes]
MALTDRSVISRAIAQHIESVTHHSVSTRIIRRLKSRVVCLQEVHCLVYPSRRTTDVFAANVRIAGTLDSQRFISEVLEPVALPYLQGLATAIFQQDNASPHVARILQRFFVNHQIELLLWPARSPDISPIENMWSMDAQR